MDNTANLISKLNSLMQQFIIRSLKKEGINGMVPSHGEIIVSLLKEERLTMNELAKRINKDPSTVTALVKKLTNLGYTKISKDKNDKRANIVYLTSKGREFKRVIKSISENLYQKQYYNIDEKEKIIFRSVLKKMIDNFKEE